MGGLRGLQVGETHLADATDRAPYIDLAYLDREGISCSLNCYMYQAFHDAALIMALLDDSARAEEYETEAEAIAEAVRRSYWDAERKLFVDRLKSDVPESEPSLHANTLPMLYGIATPEQEATALPFVLGQMAANWRVADPQKNRDCNVTSYFSYHPLRVLNERGKTREAEAFVRSCWGRYLERGAVNTWEYFVDLWSRCHAWSTSPVHFFAHQVLGITFPEPGNPDRVRIAPVDTSLDWAEGVYPHPRGPIKVSWKRRPDGTLEVSRQVPSGVALETSEAAD
jgi:hypothetical protein